MLLGRYAVRVEVQVRSGWGHAPHNKTLPKGHWCSEQCCAGLRKLDSAWSSHWTLRGRPLGALLWTASILRKTGCDRPEIWFKKRRMELSMVTRRSVKAAQLLGATWWRRRICGSPCGDAEVTVNSPASAEIPLRRGLNSTYDTCVIFSMQIEIRGRFANGK